MCWLKKVIIILLLSHHGMAFSEEQKNNKTNDLIITGLVIDETLTKGGHDFYDLFNERFDSMNANENIIISERNDFNRKIIIVSMNDTVLFEAILNPQADAIDELVTGAIAKIIEVILQEALISNELQGL
jgi:curli production assembly/transport component CsgE